MDKKTLLDGYKGLQDALQAIEAKGKALDRREDLSTSGKQAALEAFIDEQGIPGMTSRLASDLEAVAAELEEKWAAACLDRLKDKDYQDTLAAAESAISGGYLRAPGDLGALAEYFSGDPAALARLSKAAASRKIVVAGFAAGDKRERVLGDLSHMAADVKAITPARMKTDPVTVALTIKGNTDYLRDRLDDDFNYIPHSAEQVG